MSTMRETQIALLLALELLHLVSHLLVLFRIRLPPRTDMLKYKWYFATELITPIMGLCYCTDNRLRLLFIYHLVGHVFSIYTWNSSSFCTKIINWSSLEWSVSSFQKTYEWDMIVTTTSDAVVHGVVAGFLAVHVTLFAALVSSLVALLMTYAIYFRVTSHWCNPENITDQLLQRMRPLRDKYDSNVDGRTY